MTMTETKKHTYEFGSAGNSYFNGSDGTITRDDGKTVRFNLKDHRYLAVEVKERSFGLRDSAPEEVKRMAKELPGRYDHDYGQEVSADQWAYDNIAKEHFWNDAEYCCVDDPEAPDWATGVHSAGRSSGWCVIEGSEHLAEQGFPAKTPDFMVNSDGTYKPFAVRQWEVGKLIDDGTKVVAAFDTEEEAETYIEEHASDTIGMEIDEDFAVTLRMRDEFATLCFDIVGCIDGAHEALEEWIREEYEELEARREANTIRSDN